MGMSSKVTGFVSAEDPTYKKHVKVLRACLEAGVSNLPKETAEYFDNEWPEEYLIEEKLKVNIPHREYRAEMQEGFEIDIDSIPEGVKVIRFVNSW